MGEMSIRKADIGFVEDTEAARNDGAGLDSRPPVDRRLAVAVAFIAIVSFGLYAWIFTS